MKRCPECRRDYYDDSLLYCLDDGAALLEGPALAPKGNEEPLTALLSADEAPTRLQAGSGSAQEDLLLAGRKKVRLSIGITIAALLTAAGIGFYIYTSATGSTSSIRSIAVLPLDNLSGDPAQDYFADGMTDALINDLSKLRALKVISRTSVMRYKDSKDSLPKIASELGVDAVIEGSVQRSGDRVRINAQLIPANTDSPIWSKSYERQIADVLKLQGELAKSIATEIRLQLSSVEQERLRSINSVEPEAYNAYLLGLEVLHKWNEADLANAIRYFQLAIERDPMFADAHARLAMAWNNRGTFGGTPITQSRTLSRRAAERALEIDPGNSNACSVISALEIEEWDWKAGEEYALKAIEYDPGNAEAYRSLGWVLQATGRFSEIDPIMERAEQLDPLSSVGQSNFGRYLYRARRYDLSEMHLRRAIELDPDDAVAWERLSDLYLAMGRYQDALTAADRVRSPVKQVKFAVIYATAGDKVKAVETFEGQTFPAVQTVWFYAAMGDKDKTFAVIEEGLRSNSIAPSILVWDPRADPLRPDPRWEALVKRFGLPLLPS